MRIGVILGTARIGATRRIVVFLPIRPPATESELSLRRVDPRAFAPLRTTEAETWATLSRAATASIRLATRCTWAYFGPDETISARLARSVFAYSWLPSCICCASVSETRCSRW